MSRRANATLIGLFIVGAIILAIGAAFLFGSGVLRDKYRFVMFFDSSVRGLDIGAPVNFRGVKIGNVTDVHLMVDPDTLRIVIPVYADLEVERISLMSGEKMTKLRIQRVGDMIDQGLRAQLQLESLLTGQLAIQLDMHPDTPAKLVGVINEYREIPTIPTPMQEISRKLEDFPVEKVLNDVASAIEGIEKLANDPNLLKAIQSIDQTFNQYTILAERLDQHTGKISGDLNLTLTDLRATLKSTRGLIESGDGLISDSSDLVKELRDSAERLSSSAEGALNEIQTTAGVTNNIVSPDSQLYYLLTQTLQEITSAARAINSLANTLEKNPEALLRGKSSRGN